MGQFIIEKFYLFFQGIILFQAFFFGMIFTITRRKEILYYSLFILTQLLYFFLNAPNTFFGIEEELIFNNNWYLNTNYFLILTGNLFYFLFLKAIFRKEGYHERKLDSIIQKSIILLPLLMICFLIFPLFNFSRSIIFYLANVFTFPASIYIIYRNRGLAKGYESLIINGIIGNIVGTLLTVLMIYRYNMGIRVYSFDDYPLLYMRLGILVEIFFYQLAILRRWNDQEKLLATKDIQNKLDISNLKNQISRELHDDVGTTLSKINLQSFMAQSKLKNENFNIAPTLQSIQNESQDLIKRLKNLIWSIDEVVQDFDLIPKLEEYGSTMCESKNIRFTIDNASTLLGKIGIGIKYHLLMICREAINNSVKYSQAKSLNIKIYEKENYLLIRILDDGIGLKEKSNKDGNGLINMKQRIQQLNGKISFATQHGFEINLSIPL